ncbi:DUF6538 domain-containing protein [Rhodopseudomonas palustris]|uniref:DUF6538 domain-containing protein n=1 Tax=Rhodopseudomonas palustris TaxID=1076 RepID=UPI002ACD5508|nr:DUF6538 domain-containing protein [Rhodopseudomonas palustris]WQH02063.1 DUF6538 domain-containing protein [Rhodopseudomonas palustris]
MSRPWKHPNSGVYWLRRAVPEDLRALVGKREEKRSLQTRDPAEAKRRHAAALADLESRWANLRAGPKPITEREAHKLVAFVYDEWLEQHREHPSAKTFWQVGLVDRLFVDPEDRPPRSPSDIKSYFTIEEGSLKVREMEDWCLQEAQSILRWKGLSTELGNTRTVARALARAVERASLTLQRWANGESDSSSYHLASVAPGLSTAPPQEPLPLPDIVQRWAAERRPAEKTLYEWSRVVRQLGDFLNQTDARRITEEDLIRWKSAMVADGLRPKTIQDAKLAPIRAILQWAVQNKLLKSNPAEGVTLDAKSKQGEKKRSFTDEEAKLVLKAAAAERDPVRRWVPWIGAYSGARISEICQLRSEDIKQIDGIWCMAFAPEAGSLKTSGSERIIPVHPALIEAGFLKFAATVKSGPLFAELAPDKFGKRGGNGTKVVGRFVRQLGLKDPRLSPSHSWRHRIKTSGRKFGLAQDILNAITGHGAKSVADSYGEFPVEALYREISKIPALDVRG